jgi:hypothetical protein
MKLTPGYPVNVQEREPVFVREKYWCSVPRAPKSGPTSSLNWSARQGDGGCGDADAAIIPLAFLPIPTTLTTAITKGSLREDMTVIYP